MCQKELCSSRSFVASCRLQFPAAAPPARQPGASVFQFLICDDQNEKRKTVCFPIFSFKFLVVKTKNEKQFDFRFTIAIMLKENRKTAGFSIFVAQYLKWFSK